MLEILFFTAAPIAGSIAIFVAVALGVIYYQKTKNRKRWSPLTSKLLRGPGHKLVQEIDETNIDVDSMLVLVWIAPLIMYGGHLSVSYFAHQPESLLRIVIDMGATLMMEGYAIRKLFHLIDVRNRLREGYEAENAVGSELNQLMLDGAHVFHDLQAEGFNIDHLVISPKGVFSIETKSRAKYVAMDEKPNPKVEFDGASLIFPSHKETKPIEQARNNAKWTQDWLTKAVGEPINVRPALALPGWYVTSTARSEVLVLNGKGCRQFFSTLRPHQPLTDAQIQRIAYQVDQRCRDVEPTRYRRVEKSIRTQQA